MRSWYEINTMNAGPDTTTMVDCQDLQTMKMQTSVPSG